MTSEGSGTRRPRSGGSSSRVTRKQFVEGASAAAVGGVIVGGAGGFFGGKASASNASSTSSVAAKSSTLTIGGFVPITGPSASDGQDMLRGMTLAVDEINASGGVAGHRLAVAPVDSKDQTPDVMINGMRKLVADGVALIISPFLTLTNVELPIVGRSGIPMFHSNTFQGNVDFVLKHGYRNIWQICSSEIWYAQGFVTVLDEIIASGKFSPRSKSIAIVTGNDAFDLNISRTVSAAMKQVGWKVVQFDTYSPPQSEWGSVLTRLRGNRPDVIFQASYFPADDASFITQFVQAPTKSLVFQNYAPSVPAYLQLAKQAGEGMLWASTSGSILSDAIGQRFASAYAAKFGQKPGLANAGAQYDAVHIWAAAAGTASDPLNYTEVVANIDQEVHRGVNGSYSWLGGVQTCLPYPAKIKDASLGLPLMTYQIQNGQQVVISPEPYVTGSFHPQSWT